MPAGENSEHRPLGMPWHLLLVALPLLLFTIHSFHYISEMVDDAFISFRYALNLAAGNGMVFNAGEFVEGTSAPVYTMILAAIVGLSGALPADLIEIARIIGVGSSFLSMLIVYALAIRVFRLPWYAGLLILVGLALNPYYTFWSMNGMETNFHGFLLLAILCVFEYSRLGPAHRFVPNTTPPATESWSIKSWLTVVAGVFILCASRPEAPLFVGAYVAYRMIDSIIIRHYQLAFRWGAAGLGGLLLLFALRYGYYGDIFPNTFYAKADSVGLWREGGWKYFETFFSSTPLILSLNAVAGIGLLAAFRRDHILHLILIAGCFLFAYYSNGDWMFNYRLAIPGLPSYFLLFVYGIFAWKTILKRLPRAVPQAAVAITIGAVIVSWADTFQIYRDRSYFIYEPLSSEKESVLPSSRPGDLIAPLIVYPGYPVLNYCEADERVMMGDIGFPAFIVDNPVLDSRGLTDRAIARTLYYKYRDNAATHASYSAQVIQSLDTDPPCAVNLLPASHYLAEKHFTANMIDDYVKVDKRTYIRKPGNMLPIAARVRNWEKAWSRMPRSKLIAYSYMDTLVEAGDVDALSRLERYYRDKPVLFKRFRAKLRRSRDLISRDTRLDLK